jgi:hypothetical protein
MKSYTPRECYLYFDIEVKYDELTSRTKNITTPWPEGVDLDRAANLMVSNSREYFSYKRALLGPNVFKFITDS